MSQCWPFSGPQPGHFRAFANSFVHPRHPLDSQSCSNTPLPCTTEWRLAARVQAEQWVLQAAAAVADLPRRFPVTGRANNAGSNNASSGSTSGNSGESANPLWSHYYAANLPLFAAAVNGRPALPAPSFANNNDINENKAAVNGSKALKGENNNATASITGTTPTTNTSSAKASSNTNSHRHHHHHHNHHYTGNGKMGLGFSKSSNNQSMSNLSNSKHNKSGNNEYKRDCN